MKNRHSILHRILLKTESFKEESFPDMKIPAKGSQWHSCGNYHFQPMNEVRMAGIFITGATSGLGWALAIEAVKEGAPIGIVGRRKERLDILSKLLEGKGGTVFRAEADVTDRSQIEKAAKDYIAIHGAPDLLIANAGVRGTSQDSDGTNDLAMETNYFGAIHTIQPFIPAMVQRGKGHILVISSLASKLSLPGSGTYCASKAAIDRWAGSKRFHLSPLGVFLTIVSPGFIQTEMTRDNPYPMPFMMSASRAAEIIFQKIQSKNGTRKEIRFPFALSAAITFLNMLPSSFQERVLNRKQTRTNNRRPSQ